MIQAWRVPRREPQRIGCYQRCVPVPIWKIKSWWGNTAASVRAKPQERLLARRPSPQAPRLPNLLLAHQISSTAKSIPAPPTLPTPPLTGATPDCIGMCLVFFDNALIPWKQTCLYRNAKTDRLNLPKKATYPCCENQFKLTLCDSNLDIENASDASFFIPSQWAAVNDYQKKHSSNRMEVSCKKVHLLKASGYRPSAELMYE